MFGSLNISVSGISAQDAKMASISANIANSNTTGYKGIGTKFSTLFAGEEHGGGVIHTPDYSISVQGRIENTQSMTDIAVEGEGMLAVNSDPEGTGEILYTREGSFKKDSDGNLRNIGGVYLMALPTSSSDITPSFGSLEVVNLNKGLSDVAPTESISVTLNLDANEKQAEGISYTFVPNRGLDSDVLLYDPKLRVEDGLQFDIGDASYSAFYGGICAGVSTEYEILGAKDSKSEMVELKEGEGFLIKDDAGNEHAFKFKRGFADSGKGEFNTIDGLSKAINLLDGYISSLVDGVLCVGARNSFEGMTFKNLDSSTLGESKISLSTLFNSTQFLSSKDSIDLSQTQVLGASIAADIFTAAMDGDGLDIVMSDGKSHFFTYKQTSPSYQDGQFNSLVSLSQAINNSSLGSSLQATISGDILKLSVPGELTINSISNYGSFASNFATALKLDADVSFKSPDLIDGDKITIDYGTYLNIESKPDNNYAYSDNSTVFGSKVDGTGVSATNPIFGASDTATVFNQGSLNTGDGIEIITDKGGITVKYNASGTLTGTQFNSMDTLSIAINQVGSSKGISSTITDGKLVIQVEKGTSGTPTQITQIKNYTPGSLAPTDFVGPLGIERKTMPAVGDKMLIALADNQRFDFLFTGFSSGSGPAGVPDYTKFEFNNVATFQKALSYATLDQLATSVNNTGNKMNLQTTANCLTSISSVKGDDNLVNFLGLGADSTTLDFTYLSGHNPDTSLGQFNSVPTFIQAVKRYSDGVIKPVLDSGNKLKLDVENDGSLHYIRNKNILGTSNLASSFGLEGYDMISSLGLNNISAVSGKRFNKMGDLASLLNTSMSNQSAVGSGGSLVFTAKSVLDRFTISNTQNILSNAPLGINPGSDFLSAFKVGPIVTEPLYVADDQTRNMSSSSVKGSYSSNVMDLYDSLGVKHELISRFLKVSDNYWIMEIAANPDEIVSSSGRTDGLLASVELNFNGDGVLQSALMTDASGSSGSALKDGYPLRIDWNNGASPSLTKIGLGERATDTLGDKEDFYAKQIGGRYFFSAKRDGAGSSSVNGVDINEEGIISMHFTNGEARDIYKIPLVSFPNYDGMSLLSNNIYSASSESGTGQIDLIEGDASRKIRSHNLESANVEILDELTAMIPTQHAYYANSKVIQTITKMLDELRKLE